MRVSGVFRKQVEVEREEIPPLRIALWAAIGVAVAVGLVLYFLFARFMSPLI